MKKLWIWIALVIAAAVVIAVVASRRGGSSGEIRIGAILPLTGGAGKYGEDARLGMDLAVAEINDRGGINRSRLVILYEDDQSNPQQSVLAFRKLVAVHKVPAILGPMTSSSALAVAPIAEQLHVVLLSPAASAPALSTAGDFIFRNELSDAYGGTAQAELTYKKLKLKHVAIIYINNDYGVGVKDAFVKTFRSFGGEVPAVEAFEPDAQDFRTQLARIKQAAPNALFLIAQKETALLLRQIKEFGLNAQLLATPLFQDNEILQKARDLAEGVVYVYYGGFDPTAGDEVAQRFARSFEAKFGRPPGYYSALAYDAVGILAEAIRRGGQSSASIRDALYRIEDFPGVTGKTTFDAAGDVSKPVTLKTVRNGEFVEYTPE